MQPPHGASASHLRWDDTQQCDEIQGYYFSEPLPADELANKVRGPGLSLKKWTTV